MYLQNVSYRDGIEYLKSKTPVSELYNQFGGRVAVCPDWNGRVMTSSCNGAEGNSFGFINVKAVESGETEWAHSFFGGEDQLMFCPEGGPFSIYYTAGSQNAEKPIQCPAGFREGKFQIDSLPQDNEIRMRRSVQMTNLAGATFDLDIVRTIRLLDLNSIRSVFGNTVAVSLEQTDVSYVGFSSVNSMHNGGASFSPLSGLVSMRLQSMFNANPSTVAVIPLRDTPKEVQDNDEHSAVQTDFFGTSPHGRFRLLPSAALLRCDGKHRCQVRVLPKQASAYLGAIDFREGSLTLVSFDKPSEHAHYLCNDYCETVSSIVPDYADARQHFLSRSLNTPALSAESAADSLPDTGEVLRAYNHGPVLPGDKAEPNSFYEFDVFAPAAELTKGDSQTHHQHTLHINADKTTLEFLVQKILATDYGEVYEKMMR